MGLACQLLDDRPQAEAVVMETFWQVWRAADVAATVERPLPDWLLLLVYSLAQGRRGTAVSGH
jgi:hypothetical protein